MPDERCYFGCILEGVTHQLLYIPPPFHRRPMLCFPHGRRWRAFKLALKHELRWPKDFWIFTDGELAAAPLEKTMTRTFSNAIDAMITETATDEAAMQSSEPRCYIGDADHVVLAYGEHLLCGPHAEKLQMMAMHTTGATLDEAFERWAADERTLISTAPNVDDASAQRELQAGSCHRGEWYVVPSGEQEQFMGLWQGQAYFRSALHPMNSPNHRAVPADQIVFTEDEKDRRFREDYIIEHAIKAFRSGDRTVLDLAVQADPPAAERLLEKFRQAERAQLTAAVRENHRQVLDAIGASTPSAQNVDAVEPPQILQRALEKLPAVAPKLRGRDPQQTFWLYNGAAAEMLAGFPENSIDVVITDPPYEMGFMEKKWDKTGVAFDPRTWAAVLRVLKPGGYMLVFGGTRTHHRMTTAIEDGGFEIRDVVQELYSTAQAMVELFRSLSREQQRLFERAFPPETLMLWLYGSGFPKSLDAAKAIREMLGAEAPQADDWEGWGTALKPANEPIVLARKPLETTVAGTLLAHGTGALNIDAGRIPGDGRSLFRSRGQNAMHEGYRRPYMDDPDRAAEVDTARAERMESVAELGRWPANVVLMHTEACGHHVRRSCRREQCNGSVADPICYECTYWICARCNQAEGELEPSCRAGCVESCPVRQLNEQSGKTGGHTAVHGDEPSSATLNVYNPRKRTPSAFHGDSGGAARFFYCAKPSRRERDLGCEHLAPRSAGEATERQDGSAGLNSPRAGAGRTGGVRNFHPTVKPLDFLRYLVRLVARPGAVVLDPFMGSGTTGMAAVLEHCTFVGVDVSAEYLPIAQARLTWAVQNEEEP